MFGLVKFLLRLNYVYARLIGVVNFEIDMQTGRPSLTTKATIYAAVVNLLIFSMLPVLLISRVWQLFLVRKSRLHEYVFLVVLFMRVSCVVVTMLSRWWQRQRLVQLIHSYRRLVLGQPQVMRLWQRGVISKTITGTLTECIHMGVGLYGLHDSLTPTVALSIFLIYVLIGLLNVILAQYYFALLNIHGHYLLINQELRSIMKATHALELNHRQDLCQTRICALANRLDSLARLQAQLQSLVQRMTHIFGLQTLCMFLTFEITMISGIYFGFSALKYGMLKIDLTSWHNIFILLGVVSYIADSHITYSVTTYVQDLYAELKDLVTQYAVFAPDLDSRLAIAFESFKLQLIHNPQKLSVMGLYCMDRTNILSMLGSLLSYSLILIQYDLRFTSE